MTSHCIHLLTSSSFSPSAYNHNQGLRSNCAFNVQLPFTIIQLNLFTQTENSTQLAVCLVSVGRAHIPVGQMSQRNHHVASLIKPNNELTFSIIKPVVSSYLPHISKAFFLYRIKLFHIQGQLGQTRK